MGRAVLQGAQEVLVQLHRLGVATSRLDRLGGEDLALDDGVDQLGEAGASLDPPIIRSQASIRPGSLRWARANGLCDGRVVAQERRLDAIRLDELGDQLEEDLVLVPGGVDCDVVRRGIPRRVSTRVSTVTGSPTLALTAG